MTNKSPRLFHLVVTSSSSYETHCLRHPQAESSDSLVITVRSIVVILTHTTSSESAQNLIGHHDLVDALPRFGRISISVWRSRGGAHPFTYFGFGGAAVEEERRTPTPGDDPFTSPPPPARRLQTHPPALPPTRRTLAPASPRPLLAACSDAACLVVVWRRGKNEPRARWWCEGGGVGGDGGGGVAAAVWRERWWCGGTASNRPVRTIAMQCHDECKLADRLPGRRALFQSAACGLDVHAIAPWATVGRLLR